MDEMTRMYDNFSVVRDSDENFARCVRVEPGSIELLNTGRYDVIVFKFSIERHSFGDVAEFARRLKKEFPNRIVVCIPEDTSLEFCTKETLMAYVEHLQNALEERSW